MIVNQPYPNASRCGNVSNGHPFHIASRLVHKPDGVLHQLALNIPVGHVPLLSLLLNFVLNGCDLVIVLLE